MNTPELKGQTLSDEPQQHEHIQCDIQIDVAPSHQVTITTHLECESHEREIHAAQLLLTRTSRDIVIDVIEQYPLFPIADYNPNEISGEHTITGDRFALEDDDHSYFVIVAGHLNGDEPNAFVFHRRLELG